MTAFSDEVWQTSGAFVHGDRCWTFWCDGSGAGIVRALTADGVVAEYPVADAGPGALTANIVGSDDGAVWATLDYSVTRIADDKATTWHLDLDVEGQMDATPGSFLSGTWLTAAVGKQDSILVARLNVPYLTEIVPSGAHSAGPALPVELAGSRGMARSGDEILIAGGWLSDTPAFGVLKGDEDTLQRGAPEVWAFDGATPLTQGGIFDRATGGEESVSAPNPTVNLWRRSAGGAEAWWDQSRNVVVHSGWGELKLDTREAMMVGVPGDDSDKTVEAPEQLSDLRFDDRGRLWIVRGGGRRLDLWG